MALPLETTLPSRKIRSILLVLIPITFIAFLFFSCDVPTKWTKTFPKFQATIEASSAAFTASDEPLSSSPSSPIHPPPPPPPTAHLHILIPANAPNANLCKSVLSIVLLGYGVPTLYGWNGSDNLMGKITSFNPYLSTLDSSHDDDIVLITDGFDVWFQLPPQVLIDRFHAVNQRGVDRSHMLYSKNSTAENTTECTTQGIVFASQKKCWPGEEDAHVSCLSVPESSLLPKDVYGPDSDKIRTDEKNPYQHVRRRYLNAGFVMGGVKDLRPLWKRAMEKAEADMDVFGHDQHVLAEIFGEQEAARRVAAGDQAKGQSGSVARGMYNFEPKEGVSYEFGMGLDYASELSLPTVFGAEDIGWVTFSNRSSISKAARRFNIPDQLVRAKKLSADINNQSGPFQAVPKDRIDTEKAEAGWEDVPIFTDLYTGVSPVLIHHNEWRDNLKSRVQTEWDRIWFQPYGRALLESMMMNANDLIAVDRDGREWRSSVPWKRELGVRTITEEGEAGWVAWDSLCGGEEAQKELFRDGEEKWAR